MDRWSEASGADEGSLRAIAERQDQAAFAELFERYRRRAYSLAFHIIGEEGLSEDAVQTAMLSVWRNAQQFRGGKADHWILRIVVNCSIRVRQERSGRRDVSSFEGQAAAERAPAKPLPGADLAQAESAAAVRAALGRLPEKDRILVALHYSAGLSQSEIARTLKIPRRTISSRLQVTMDRLRQDLKAAGYQEGQPQLFVLALQQALSEHPHGNLKPPSPARLQEELTRSEKPRTSSWVRLTGPLLAATIVISALALGSAWLSSRGDATKSPPAGTKTVFEAPGGELIARWTFEDGLPKDIELLSSVWTLQAAQTGQPAAAVTTGEERLWAALPALALPKQFVLSLKARTVLSSPRYFSPLDRSWEGCRADWMEGDRLLPFRTACRPQPLPAQPLGQIAQRWYFLGPRVVGEVNGSLESVSRFTTEGRSGRIVLKPVGMAIEEIEVRALRDADIPSAYRAADLLLKTPGDTVEKHCNAAGLLPPLESRDRQVLTAQNPRIFFDFKSDDPNVLHPLGSPWEWRRQEGAALARDHIWVLAPVAITGEPILISTIRRNLIPSKAASIGLLPALDRLLIPVEQWTASLNLAPTELDQADRIYLLPPYVFGYVGSQLLFVQQLTPYGRMNRFALRWSNSALASIEFRLLSQAEIPEPLQNPPALIQALGVHSKILWPGEP